MIFCTKMNRKAGIQIHRNSTFRTVKPRWLKKAPRPRGETSMGVQGKKYLWLENGDNRAIPRPPLVIASKSPWLAVRRKK